MNIQEDYVSFEVAKLLKEKGFDQNCATYYLDGQVWRHYHGEVIPKDKQIYAAPTQAMAMKWLREVHNIGIFPTTFYRHTETFDGHNYGCTLVNLKTFDVIGNFEDCTFPADSYEEACESAIKYYLENLI